MANTQINPVTFLAKPNSTTKTSTSPVVPAASYTSSTSLQNNAKHIVDSTSMLMFTLPSKSNVGDTIWVLGYGTGGWKIAQNPGQTIHALTNTTTGTAGSLMSTARYDSVELVCIVADKEYTVQSVKGTIMVA